MGGGEGVMDSEQASPPPWARCWEQSQWCQQGWPPYAEEWAKVAEAGAAHGSPAHGRGKGKHIGKDGKAARGDPARREGKGKDKVNGWTAAHGKPVHGKGKGKDKPKGGKAAHGDPAHGDKRQYEMDEQGRCIFLPTSPTRSRAKRNGTGPGHEFTVRTRARTPPTPSPRPGSSGSTRRHLSAIGAARFGTNRPRTWGKGAQ